MKHTVVVSDVHLCEPVDTDGVWMRWRQRPYFPSGEFVALVDCLLGAFAAGDRAELVFNGDLFDFDAGRVLHGKVMFEDLPRSEPVSVDLMRRMLNEHGAFVTALGRWLSSGHEITFIAGNHDPQLGFEGVQRVVRERLSLAAGHPRFAEAIRFRSWFHHTDDGIHIEHGNQYDPYCSFRYPMRPLVPPRRGHDREIAPTVGSITFRLLGARLGTMNPHFDDSWDMSAVEYARHWIKHYLTSDHSLAWPWLAGSFGIVHQTWLGRDSGSEDRFDRNVDAAAREVGVDPERVSRHAKLFSPPADEVLHKVIREFYVDRLVLGALSVAAVLVPVFVRNRKAVGAAVGSAMLMAAYELALPSRGLDDNYRRIAARARDVAEIYNPRAVVFGHTHVAYSFWEEGVLYANSGTWSPAIIDVESGEMGSHEKPVIWLRTEGQTLDGGLYMLDGMNLIRRDGATSPVPERRRDKVVEAMPDVPVEVVTA